MRVLKLPVNENWYKLILSGKLTFDYREIKPYWITRLDGKEYDTIEFYHRFKKEIEPIRYKFKSIKKDKLQGYNIEVYIIEFGDRVD